MTRSRRQRSDTAQSSATPEMKPPSPGGAGTGVVLSTRGKEVSLPAGTSVSVKLTEPVTVRVRVR